ncbi:MAG: GyrI-like domain-containing protein [Chloroflexota bacterium]
MKLDLRAEYKQLYNPPADRVSSVEVPPLLYLMVDGEGDPNTAPAWQEAMEALYGVSYALKFMSKRGPDALDYTVMPLEGLWWSQDLESFSVEARGEWLWTAMIMQPPHITQTMAEQAIAETRRKKSALLSLDRLRLERYDEGLCAQVMHLGPYATEGPTIQRLHAWILDHGYEYRGAGKHHEIYLGDPRRTAPEKLKTVIRQPMRPRDA